MTRARIESTTQFPIYLRRCRFLDRIRPEVQSSTFPRTWPRIPPVRAGLHSVPWCPESTRRGKSTDHAVRRRVRAACPASIARRTRCRSATSRRRSSRTLPATLRRTRPPCSVPCRRRARERDPGPIRRCTSRRRRSRNGRRSPPPPTTPPAPRSGETDRRLRGPSDGRWQRHSSRQ